MSQMQDSSVAEGVAAKKWYLSFIPLGLQVEVWVGKDTSGTMGFELAVGWRE